MQKHLFLKCLFLKPRASPFFSLANPEQLKLSCEDDRGKLHSFLCSAMMILPTLPMCQASLISTRSSGIPASLNIRRAQAFMVSIKQGVCRKFAWIDKHLRPGSFKSAISTSWNKIEVEKLFCRSQNLTHPLMGDCVWERVVSPHRFNFLH